MRYKGGKGQAGVYQRIISEMPPHDYFVSGFLGGGKIEATKRESRSNPYFFDRDKRALEKFVANYPARAWGAHFICANFIAFLEVIRFPPGTLIYMDPPYPFSVRRSRRRIYRYEMTDADHERLLKAANNQPHAMMMISGYRCELYDDLLGGDRWRRIDYETRTRTGMVTESLWCSFDPPERLHDPQFAGEGYRERERIKRKRARLRAKLATMSPAERSALLDVLQEFDAGPVFTADRIESLYDSFHPPGPDNVRPDVRIRLR